MMLVSLVSDRFSMGEGEEKHGGAQAVMWCNTELVRKWIVHPAGVPLG